jgi:hypothetical protein
MLWSNFCGRATGPWTALAGTIGRLERMGGPAGHMLKQPTVETDGVNPGRYFRSTASGACGVVIGSAWR